jgi:hypothetical protein
VLRGHLRVWPVEEDRFQHCVAMVVTQPGERIAKFAAQDDEALDP